MPVTEDGFFIKDYLDLYKKNNGSPPADQKAKLDNFFSPVFANEGQIDQTGAPKPGDTTAKPADTTAKPTDTKQAPVRQIFCGKTMADLNQMSFEELWKFIQSCPEILQ